MGHKREQPKDELNSFYTKVNKLINLNLALGQSKRDSVSQGAMYTPTYPHPLPERRIFSVSPSLRVLGLCQRVTMLKSLSLYSRPTNLSDQPIETQPTHYLSPSSLHSSHDDTSQYSASSLPHG